MSKPTQPIETDLTLDQAIQEFAAYARGESDFDELDLKGYLFEVWLPQRFIERSRIKKGWNAKGEKL